MVIDDTYETLCYAWRVTRYWHPVRHCYVVALVSPWRFGHAPAADPDALIDAAAPLFEPQCRGGRKGTTKPAIVAVLQERGPMSPTHIAEVTGCSLSSVKNCLGNNLTTFERVGKLGPYVLYDLRRGDA